MKASQNRKAEQHFRGGSSPGLEELNLVEFPLTLLARQVPKDLKTVQFEDSVYDRGARQRVHREVIVTGADAWGLPNALDMDVFLALMKLTQDKHGFRERTVEFSLYELAGLLAWPQADGRYNQRLKESLDRWLGVTVKYTNAWRKNGRWTSTKGFHFLDNVELTNTRQEFDADEPQVFLWNKVVVESVQASNTKGLDWGFYSSLRLPSSKRLYRFLDKRFALRNGWDFELTPFCTDKLGMSRSYEPRKYKQKLSPAIQELEAKGFLSPLPQGQRFEQVSRGVYRVRFDRVAKRKRNASHKTESQPTGLVKELLDRDVRNAEQLAKKYPEQRIREQLENFDHRCAKGEKLGGGWLRKAIEEPNGYAFRADYQSKQELDAAAERERLSVAQRKREEHKRIKKDRSETGQIEAYLNGLSAEQRIEIELEAVASNPALRRWAGDEAENCSEAIKKAATHAYVEKLLVRQEATATSAEGTECSVLQSAETGQRSRRASQSVCGKSD